MSDDFMIRPAGLDIGVESRCASVRRQRELSEEPVGEESAKTHRVITLNETASFIYDGIAEGLDENAIAVKLTSEYNVPMDKALRDVKATIEKLVSAGVAE